MSSQSQTSRMLMGGDFLLNDSSTPGVRIHPEIRKLLPKIFEECRDFGLDYYPTIIEFCTYADISELAAYGGFPVRYNHWSFGMEYEELSRGFEHGRHRIYEMVVNSNPSIIYCLDSNTILENVKVICHALGHNDFFKNNTFFKGTNTDILNKFTNHRNRIRKYMSRWGKETVTEFIDHVLRLNNLIDRTKEWKAKPAKKMDVQDKKETMEYERRRYTHEYMDEWVNNDEYLRREKKRIEKEEASLDLEIFQNPEKDILGYLKDHAPLKAWQQDVVSMLYEEALYFAPQFLTKVINEGWASYVDYKLMCGRGLTGLGQKTADGGIVEYAKNKAGILGHQWSQNPYKLGFELFMDIEDRWNRGRFGTEYDECDDMLKRQEWNTNTGLGHEKVFEVRQCYNDLTLINEFFTPEFFEKMKYYEAQKFPSSNPEHEYEWRIVNRDYKKIKETLLARHTNGGEPDIRLVDPNHKNNGTLLLQHYPDGRTLYHKYAIETMKSLAALWKKQVVLATAEEDGTETVYVSVPSSSGDQFVDQMTREKYDSLEN